jgi:hypothetical protein
MVVEMIEKPQEERITLASNDGRQRVTLVQRPDAAVQIIAQGPVTVTGEKDVTISSTTGDILLRGTRVTVQATAELTLSGGVSTTVRGGVVRIN